MATENLASVSMLASWRAIAHHSQCGFDLTRRDIHNTITFKLGVGKHKVWIRYQFTVTA